MKTAKTSLQTYVVLLRGINVGGTGKLPMKQLMALLEELGGSEVRTYIQSGNAVLRSAEADPARLAKRLEAAIQKAAGFTPRTLVLTAKDLVQATKQNPFKEAEAEPQFLHLFFLSEPAKAPDFETMDRLKAASERYALSGRVLYLHTPEGLGKSKLGGRAEKCLGVDATARNWRTVQALLEMVRALK